MCNNNREFLGGLLGGLFTHLTDFPTTALVSEMLADKKFMKHNSNIQPVQMTGETMLAVVSTQYLLSRICNF